MRFVSLMSVILIALAGPVAAQKMASGTTSESGKFSIHGTTVTYDTDLASGSAYAEIEGDDIDDLTAILAANPDTKILELNSVGGSVWAGDEMARIIMDYRLDTRVVGECSSACVTIFLAGEARELARGGMIGFHQNSWSEDNMLTYYKYWRTEYSWGSPFEFSSWVYKDTQTEIYNQLAYLLARGVEPVFAIETKRERSSMWYPTRVQLQEAGVLRD